ncbi:hypothetical protein [Streptomyces sp. NPDC001828]|uniref:hypothetical protein n=1 Tax=Streptomyces sp. NPDC001828 TaxID=3364615 RepID=UPI00369AC428
MSPTTDERKRIRAAMDRIFSDAPDRSDGAWTIVALAVEAGVPRNALTQRHPDLRNEFYERVRARGQTPDHEKRLRRQIAKLKELRAADAVQIRQLNGDVEALVGALHLSQLENGRLRSQHAHPDIRVLR